jgi:hypothetical protein
MQNKKDFTSIKDVLKHFQGDRDKFISREFQKYGYDLAQSLGDFKHKALYIKLAKDTPRGFLETAKNFVKDAYQVKSKARLFMWKLKQLKEESKKKKESGSKVK